MAQIPLQPLHTAPATAVVPQPALSADEIRHLQTRLQILGFDPGTIDGELGSTTEQAIRDFQRHYELPISGRLTAVDIERLNQAVLEYLGLNKPTQSPPTPKPKVENTAASSPAQTLPVPPTSPPTSPSSNPAPIESQTTLSRADVIAQAIASRNYSVGKGDLDNLSRDFYTPSAITTAGTRL